MVLLHLLAVCDLCLFSLLMVFLLVLWRLVKRLQGFFFHFGWIEYFGGQCIYRGADKSLVRPTSRCISLDGENIYFDASLVIYINSTNIPPIMIINRIYEHQNLLSL